MATAVPQPPLTPVASPSPDVTVGRVLLNGVSGPPKAPSASPPKAATSSLRSIHRRQMDSSPSSAAVLLPDPDNRIQIASSVCFRRCGDVSRSVGSSTVGPVSFHPLLREFRSQSFLLDFHLNIFPLPCGTCAPLESPLEADGVPSSSWSAAQPESALMSSSTENVHPRPARSGFRTVRAFE